MAAKTAKTIVKSDIAKDIGKEMKELATTSLVTAAADAIEGKNPKQNLQANVNKTKQKIAKTIRAQNNKKRKALPTKRKPSAPAKKKKYNFIRD